MQTAGLDGIGGRIRLRPEDFRVEEIPAYPPDGRDDAHLLLTLTKRDWNTQAAVEQVARALGVSARDIGVAGLKDRDAVTVQWISVPARAADELAGFEHPDIQLGPAQPHGNKLRRGHLKGNRFEIVIRDLRVDASEALPMARAKLDTIATRGLLNHYGEQRFGHQGANVERGLRALAQPRRRGRGDLIVSAGQSALFNLYVALRRERGLERQVLLGDVLKKQQTGGLFTCEDPAADQARLEAGELVVTGPMFGSKMMSPPADSPSAELESGVLSRAGLEPSALKALGRKVPGTRRALFIRVDHPVADPAEPITSQVVKSTLSAGVCLRFELPAGAYATNLLREIMGS